MMHGLIARVERTAKPGAALQRLRLTRISLFAQSGLRALTKRMSQPRDIARDRLAIALRQRLQDLRHVLVAGALVVDVVAHGGDEVLVAQPGEPRGGRTALEILLVAGLALRDRLRRLAGRRRALLGGPL